MASGGISLQEAAGGSPLSASPEPGQLLGLDEVDLEQVRASPQLSRRAKDESDLENEIESEDDSENYKLHSPWTLWFDRSVGMLVAGGSLSWVVCPEHRARSVAVIAHAPCMEVPCEHKSSLFEATNYFTIVHIQ